MKLIKCYVSSFGKLKDFHYDFNDGINTIKQDNGWGKSTLAVFIKAMFYGLDGSSKRTISDNERKKFKPWNSTETFGGYVQFAWGDKEYKLERYFGNKEAEDTVALVDVKTGKSFSNTDNLGKRIFEIDAEGFSLTTYFVQKDLESKSNTSITEKFNQVSEIDSSDSFDKALAKVTAKAKEYKYIGDRGLIPDGKRELFAINEEIERANRAVNTVKILTEEEKALKVEVEELRKQTESLTLKISEAGKVEANSIKKERYDRLVSEKAIADREINEAQIILNGAVTNKDEISACERNLINLESLYETQKSIQSEIDELSLPQPQVDEKKNNKMPLVFIILTALFGVCSGVCFALLGLRSIFSWATLLFGVVFAVLFVISKISKQKTQKDLSSPYENLISQKKEKLILCQEKIDNTKRQILSYFAQFNLDENLNGNQAIKVIYQANEKYNNALLKLKSIENEIAILEPFKADFSTNFKSSESLAELNDKLKFLQRQYSIKSIELANKRSSINMHENLANSFRDLEDKKADILEKLVSYDDQLNTYNLVAKYLKIADENLKVKYRAPLQDSLNKYVSLLTDGNYSVNIDVDLNVTVCEKGGDRATEFYSKGYQNLFEICKRFALIDVLFTGEKPFIILDDTFYNLDEKKLEIALELLKKLSNEYQIIYLVCHESREVK